MQNTQNYLQQLLNYVNLHNGFWRNIQKSDENFENGIFERSGIQ
jgi:hypothetical protein